MPEIACCGEVERDVLTEDLLGWLRGGEQEPGVQEFLDRCSGDQLSELDEGLDALMERVFGSSCRAVEEELHELAYLMWRHDYSLAELQMRCPAAVEHIPGCPRCLREGAEVIYLLSADEMWAPIPPGSRPKGNLDFLPQ